MTIEIVDIPIKHGDCPQLCKRLPEGKSPLITINYHYQPLLITINHYYQRVNLHFPVAFLWLPHQQCNLSEVPTIRTSCASSSRGATATGASAMVARPARPLTPGAACRICFREVWMDLM